MILNSSFISQWRGSTFSCVLYIIVLLPFLPVVSYAQVYQVQSQSNGLERAYYGNGVSAADYDNDGLIDFYFVTRDPTNPFRVGTANLLFKNHGDGTFENVAKEAGVEGIIDTSRVPANKLILNYGASWGDFDNDGDVDLFLTNKGRDQFFENVGDGTFVDITQNAGLATLVRESTSAAWFDYDNDGDLDLYVSSYGSYGEDNTSKNVLYRNEGDKTFEDVTQTAGVGDPGYTYSTMVFDANLDGWPDLYCVNDFGANRLYINRGNGTFREATHEFGLENDGHGMGVSLGDFDNNGLFDIYLTNIADDLEFEWSPLFMQTRVGTFLDISVQSGTGITNWAWGCEFLDFDLDGDLDLYVVNGFSGDSYNNRMYRNEGSGVFSDFSFESGAASYEEARGLAVVDFNNDGCLDILVANWRKAAQLFINNIGSGNYLKINLIGQQSNRDARGAIVSITANNKTYFRSNDGIELFGQSKTPLHFGLGPAQLVQRVHVKWPGPSGSQQEFHDISSNQTITITEGVNVITDVADHPPALPQDFRILGNSPNPVRDITTLYFQTPNENRVKIEIYNLLGQRVATLLDQSVASGMHSIQWDTNRNPLSRVSAGVYLVRIQSGSLVDKHKLVVIK